MNIIKNCIKEVLEVHQNRLRKPKEKQKDDFLPFISVFSPNNAPVYNSIKNSVEVLKRNNVPGFENIELIKSKQQLLNLKKLLTKAEFTHKEVGVEKEQNLRRECCKSLLISE